MPDLKAQIKSPYKQLLTSSETIISDTISGIGLDLNESNPQAKHGEVDISIISPGGSNLPYIYKVDYRPDEGFIGVDTFVLEYRYANTFPYLAYQGFRVSVKPSIVKANTDYTLVEAG
ncbi:MAG: hypothetical protein JNJ57_20575, partial [Saprospiraceae bacterium]|nr:hypothetical protein [Saprospiraceae bacterium]